MDTWPSKNKKWLKIKDKNVTFIKKNAYIYEGNEFYYGFMGYG